MVRDISRKCSLVNTPTAGTPLVFRAMLKHEKNYMMPMGPQAYRMKKGKGIFIRTESEEVKDLAALLVKRFDVFQGCLTLRAGGDCMDDDGIRVWDRLKYDLYALLTTRRALTLRPQRLGPLKLIHRGRATAVAVVLVQLEFEVGNLSLEASTLITEFRDETLKITDDYKKNRDVLNGVLGKGSILDTGFRIWVFNSHYILFGGHYKKIFQFGLNSYGYFM